MIAISLATYGHTRLWPFLAVMTAKAGIHELLKIINRRLGELGKAKFFPQRV
jgi:hypothetical protein